VSSLSSKLQADKKFEFTSGSFDADKFCVVNMTGFEAIAKPFSFTLTLVADDADVDFDQILQSPATFTIYSPDGESSYPYHGVISEFEQLQQMDGHVFYRAVLVPRLWHLSLTHRSDVFCTNQTIPQIIEQVLINSRLTRVDF
jgi:type VI secretion system secreted protein VgrG